MSFNTQPPEGGWYRRRCPRGYPLCFNTQPPEGGWPKFDALHRVIDVSTHSRPKAAGSVIVLSVKKFYSFNTQPPEGGWLSREINVSKNIWFQHTAARRRLAPSARFRAYA